MKGNNAQKECFICSIAEKMQPVVIWIAAGLILIAAAVIWVVLMNRPDSRAYQDAVWVCAGVAAL